MGIWCIVDFCYIDMKKCYDIFLLHFASFTDSLENVAKRSVTFSMWFLVFCWLFAPFVFNPSCFEWHKTVDDWTDWWKWMNNRGGIGLAPEQSWEAWWVSEHEHLKNGTIRSLFLELILSLRLLIYQYGIVYHLHIVHENKSFMVHFLPSHSLSHTMPIQTFWIE